MEFMSESYRLKPYAVSRTHNWATQCSLESKSLVLRRALGHLYFVDAPWCMGTIMFPHYSLNDERSVPWFYVKWQLKHWIISHLAWCSNNLSHYTLMGCWYAIKFYHAWIVWITKFIKVSVLKNLVKFIGGNLSSGNLVVLHFHRRPI